MSNTRFYNDSVRIQNQLDVLTYAGRYALNVPGPGDKMIFEGFRLFTSDMVVVKESRTKVFAPSLAREETMLYVKESL